MLSIPYRWFFYFYIEQAEVREETFFESTLPGALKAKSNGNDRRQRRKQGVAVGAAASKTQAIAKRLLGAATRRCSRRKLPAGLLTTIAVTVSFQLTVLIQAHPHPKAGERCAF